VRELLDTLVLLPEAPGAAGSDTGRSSRLQAELGAHIEALRETLAKEEQGVLELASRLERCFRGGGKVLVCGNGGSAADAQHFVAELVNRFAFDRPGLPALALSTDSSVLTCIANDAAYEQVFSRQVEALGRPGDLLLGISTSGRSPNVLRALHVARELGLTTVGLTGAAGRASLAPQCDLCLSAASTETARIQEVHEFLLHCVAGMVEEGMFRPSDSTPRGP
jgi:D-sedoheptulose 7-phosphate isomerase